MNRIFDTKNLSLHQFSPKMYCFVSTRDPGIISKLRSLKDAYVRFEEMETASEYKTFLFNNPGGSRTEIISHFCVNDLADYDLQQISARLLGGDFARDSLGDSLISLSCSNDEHFACLTDFWGITTHYWHSSRDTFVCGSNIFLVANIAGNEMSGEALYEYLFFSWPRKDHTWFKGIRRLLPGQQLVYNLKERAPRLSEGTDFSAFLEPASGDLIGSVEDFFSRAKNRIGPDDTNYIALSAGSDSRTVLACMRAFHMRPHAFSFGKHDMTETRAIARLTHRLHLPWLFIDIEGFEENFERLFAEGTFYSSGLLNPMRTHYVWMYAHVRRGSALFEGILGSEFVKGEIAVPAMASHLHHDVIAKKGSVAASIGAYHPQLPSEFSRDMADYIQTEFGAELLDVNSEKGKRAFQLYLLENVPSKCFSAVISIAKMNSLAPYYPFLSPRVIRAIFDNDAGMRKSISVRRDFIGPIRSLKAEAMIVKHMDDEIFNSVLDRNVRFREALESERVAKLRKRARDMRGKARRGKLFGGQIDVSKLVAKLRNYEIDSLCGAIPLDGSKTAANGLLANAAINCAWLRRISETILE